MNLSLDPRADLPLVDQIVQGMKSRVDERMLRAGARLPSIRAFAADHGVSRFTVVEAYDRLVALGYLESRPGSGFYVLTRGPRETAGPAPVQLDRAGEVVDLMRQVLADAPGALKAGGGWLPPEWMDQEGIQRQLRSLAREPGAHLTCYGHPQGYPPLRAQLALRLTELGVNAGAEQIVLTQGASQGLDLLVRLLLKPGDAVLVDDPGYYNLFGNLRLAGITLLGIPRTIDGPDPAALEALAAEHRPKVFFTQSVLHNPTGAGLSPATAFRILQAAERHDFLVVEDDIYADFQSGPAQRLATLDQLQRVVHVGSFSKTLSASLRVGFVAARADLVRDLTDVKILSSIGTSEFSERLVFGLLTGGHYRKYLERVRERLAQAREVTVRNLEGAGFQVFCDPPGGLFVYARPARDDAPDAMELARAAAAQNILLAPGRFFRPRQEPTPWLRFSAPYCADRRLWRFLAGALA